MTRAEYDEYHEYHEYDESVEGAVRAALADLLTDEPPREWSAAADLARGRALRHSRRHAAVTGVAVLALCLGSATVAVVARQSPSLGSVQTLGKTPAGAPTTTPTPSPTLMQTTPGYVDATKLVGYWTVGGTDVDDGATLQFGTGLGATDVVLWRDCGGLSGTWVASPVGGFAASLYEADAACAADSAGSAMATPSWLSAAASYRLAATSVELVDTHGVVVAHLVPGVRHRVGPKRVESWGELPADLSAIEAWRTDLVPPPGVVSAPSSDLVGTWRPVPEAGGHTSASSFLRLRADGVYESANECPGMIGRWDVDAAGTLITTYGPILAVLCEGIDAGPWLIAARAAVVRGGVLTLIGADGAAIGSLERVGS